MWFGTVDVFLLIGELHCVILHATLDVIRKLCCHLASFAPSSVHAFWSLTSWLRQIHFNHCIQIGRWLFVLASKPELKTHLKHWLPALVWRASANYVPHWECRSPERVPTHLEDGESCISTKPIYSNYPNTDLYAALSSQRTSFKGILI